MNLEFCVCVCQKKGNTQRMMGACKKKKYRCELHGAFNSQTWNNLSTKIEIRLTDYNALNTIHVCEYIQI